MHAHVYIETLILHERVSSIVEGMGGEAAAGCMEASSRNILAPPSPLGGEN